jgi:phosphate transport system substrate-binding protein
MASRTAGAIGYVEYAYAKQNKLTFALLRNKDGQFVTPEIKTFQSAASNADWAKAQDFYVLLTNQPGKDSWPITGASFILMHKQQTKPDVAREALNFFDWCYGNGAQLAEQLDYVPMPENVVKLVEQSCSKSRVPTGNPCGPGGPPSFAYRTRGTHSRMCSGHGGLMGSRQ